MEKSQMIPAGMTLGGEEAEDDPLLHDAFYTSSQFALMENRDDPRCFLIGRTGSGKSAILDEICKRHPAQTIRLNPEDLSLPYISNLTVIKELTAMGVRMDAFFNALWKHVFVIEIIKKKYKSGARKNLLDALIDKLSKEPGRAEALAYLRKYEGKFWHETDARIREVAEDLKNRVSEIGTPDSIFEIPLPRAQMKEMSERRTTKEIEYVERYQKIIDDSQYRQLSKMLKVIDEEILASDRDFTYIVIDDLDKEWVDETIMNDLLRCLFTAVRDLRAIEKVKIIVALRTNIFEQLNFGGPAGGQEEKFRSKTQHMRWTARELGDLLDLRVRAATANRQGGALSGLAPLLPPPNAIRGRGSAKSFVLERTLMRPRDAIAFLNECLVHASGHSRLSWDDLKVAEREYSRLRLLALRDEWKPSYPNIDKVFHLFNSSPLAMSPAEFMSRLDDVASLGEPYFPASCWLEKFTTDILLNPGEWPHSYRSLTELLYRIGFIGFNRTKPMPEDLHGLRPIQGLRKSDDQERLVPVWSYDEPNYVEDGLFMRSPSVVVHPTFRSTLNI